MSKIATIPVSSLPPGVPGLVRWVKLTHPAVYGQLARALKSRASYLNGLGLTDPNDPLSEVTVTATKVPVTPEVAAATPGWGASIIDTIKGILPAALQTYQQNRIFDLQIKQAQAGKPPLDVSALQNSAAFRVGIDDATRNTAIYIVGGLALAAIGYKLLSRR